MTGFWSRAARLIEALSTVAGGIAALSILAAALIVTEGVVTRKVFGVSTTWQIEASVYLLIYACFVGAPLGQKHEHHLNVDLVIYYLSAKVREVILIVVSIIACITSAIIAWYAWPMWWESVVRNDHSGSLWNPPLWVPYFFLPLGLTLLFLQYVVQITRKIIALKQHEVSEEVIRVELRDIEIPTPGSQEKE
jgi:TRAP-type C4-dicarboxylate transport system permease small subunit